MSKKKGNNYVIDEVNNIAKIIDLERVINFPYTWFAKFNHTNNEYYAVASEIVKQMRMNGMIRLCY